MYVTEEKFFIYFVKGGCRMQARLYFVVCKLRIALIGTISRNSIIWYGHITEAQQGLRALAGREWYGRYNVMVELILQKQRYRYRHGTELLVCVDHYAIIHCL